MKPFGPLFFAGLLLASLATPAMAQDDTATPPPPRPKPCSDPAYRQFDFWIGTWDVKDTRKNAPPSQGGARNEITAVHGSCVLQESYTNGPYTGSSLNYYDAATKRWHQTWVDNQGGYLQLVGSLENGSMVLSSADPAADPIERISWTPNDDGSVRQLWQQSKDGGQTWTVAFDGRYTKTE